MSNLKKTGVVGLATGAAITALVALPVTEPQKPPRIYPGPYHADVMKITDSDTIKLRVHMWPDQSVVVGFRINGVDTPEKFRPECLQERVAAINATHFVESLISVGSRVEVSDIKTGKYARRVVGTLTFDTFGRKDTIANALITNQHAVPYDGGTKTKDWCVS